MGSSPNLHHGARTQVLLLALQWLIWLLSYYAAFIVSVFVCLDHHPFSKRHTEAEFTGRTPLNSALVSQNSLKKALLLGIAHTSQSLFKIFQSVRDLSVQPDLSRNLYHPASFEKGTQFTLDLLTGSLADAPCPKLGSLTGTVFSMTCTLFSMNLDVS